MGAIGPAADGAPLLMGGPLAADRQSVMARLSEGAVGFEWRCFRAGSAPSIAIAGDAMNHGG